MIFTNGEFPQPDKPEGSEVILSQAEQDVAAASVAAAYTGDNPYDHLFKRDDQLPVAEQSPLFSRTQAEIDADTTEQNRQLGIAAADRKNRDEAGLRPRPFELS